jgi:RNA polymerase sigma-70 factor (ECF subfamily)
MGEGVGDRSLAGGRGQTTDAALVQATRAGDLRAWEHLVRRHQEVVFRSAYLATRQSVSAEDVTKAAFLRAHHSLGSLKEGAAVRPWLVGITVGVARAHLRELAQRRDAKLPIRESTPRVPATPPPLPPGVPWPTAAEHEILVGAFDGMGDEDRVILAARYSFGLSSADAATLLGVEPAQVDERLRTSIRRLRARIGQSPGASGSRMADVSTTPGPGRRSDRLVALSDDQLGSMCLLVAFSGLPWTPDVAPATCARLAREAAAYPEQPASNAAAGGPSGEASVGAASAGGVSAGAASAGGVSAGAASPRGSSRPEGRTSLTGVPARPRRRNRGSTILRAAVLVTGFAVLGFALASAARGLQLPHEMRGSVDALLGRAASGPVGPAAEPAPEVAVPIGEPAAMDLDDDVPAGVFETSPGQVPGISIVGSRTLEDGDVGAQVRVDWQPGGELGPIVSGQLERSIAGGTWTTVTATDGSDPLLTILGPDRRYRFRVRAVDGGGAEAVSPPIGIQLTVRDPRSRRLALEPGEWITRRGNIIKLRLIATAPDSSCNTEFHGSSVALVGPAGPDRGAIGVRVDGGDWSSDDLRTWEDSPQTVVYSQDLAHGRHSLDVRAETDGVAVDAVLIVRTAGT